ncbi:50S ribosomal protein L23 [Candidatus Saganbacteria bacterium]|nr:50S ribosomal protein L23 [Candidatus Saganbacteria bacterium]
MDPYQIILEPIVTEKAFTARGERKYVFKVHNSATKIDIRHAVNKIFKVKAQAVNTVRVRSKTRSVGYKIGQTPSYKKAYVTVADGQKIEELEV